MGTLLHRCVKVRIAIELSFGVVSGVIPGIHVLDGSPRASGGGGAVSGMVFGILRIQLHRFQWGHGPHGVLIMVLIDFRVVCEKLTVFPYAEYIVEFCGSVASYDIVRFKIEVSK